MDMFLDPRVKPEDDAESAEAWGAAEGLAARADKPMQITPAESLSSAESISPTPKMHKQTILNLM